MNVDKNQCAACVHMSVCRLQSDYLKFIGNVESNTEEIRDDPKFNGFVLKIVCKHYRNDSIGTMLNQCCTTNEYSRFGEISKTSENPVSDVKVWC